MKKQEKITAIICKEIRIGNTTISQPGPTRVLEHYISINYGKTFYLNQIEISSNDYKSVEKNIIGKELLLIYDRANPFWGCAYVIKEINITNNSIIFTVDSLSVKEYNSENFIVG